MRGVNFIVNFILPNGDTLYIGRGQEQSFGYAALIYVLAQAYQFTRDQLYLGDLNNLLQYLKSYQKQNGALPLVMNDLQGEPIENNLFSTKCLGWYSYNNYFDYLAFAGFFIERAFLLLKDEVELLGINRTQRSYMDFNFRKVVTSNYISILSRPGGYWSNDIPFPMIYFRGKVVTPCYGGEQFVPSLISLSSIPLPSMLRKHSISFFIGERLIVLSLTGIFIRSFSYKEKKIIIKNFIISPFKFMDNYLFFEDGLLESGDHIETNSFSVTTLSIYKKTAKQYCAKGVLRSYLYCNIVKCIKLEFKI
jgi:hypothetical protein